MAPDAPSRNAFTGTTDDPMTVASFTGPYGEAVVRKPHAQGATKIGDGAARFHAFWRVVYWLPGRISDVVMAKDEADGRRIAEQIVNTGQIPKGK